MIMRVNLENVDDAGYVHSVGWQASHKGIVSEKFLATYTQEQQTNYFKNEIKLKDIEVYLLYEINKPVGIINIDVGKGEIKQLYVLPDYWGKGQGKKLLEYAIERLNIFNTIFLVVMNINIQARRFYEKNGFKFYGEEKMLSASKGITEMKYIYNRK